LMFRRDDLILNRLGSRLRGRRQLEANRNYCPCQKSASLEIHDSLAVFPGGKQSILG